MNPQEILKTVEFVVDQNGKPKAAMINMQIWLAFLTWLEDLEDKELVMKRIVGWKEKRGWRRSKEFEKESVL